MASKAYDMDSDSLREQLMAPDPMQRAMALHLLELELERNACASQTSLASAIAKFAARGIPYYAVQDPHYCAWVGKAVSYWERLHSGSSSAASPA
jgi:hypothetical protein